MDLMKLGHKLFLLDQHSSKEGMATSAPTTEEMFVDIKDPESIDEAFRSAKPDVVFHLASLLLQSTNSEGSLTLANGIGLH